MDSLDWNIAAGMATQDVILGLGYAATLGCVSIEIVFNS